MIQLTPWPGLTYDVWREIRDNLKHLGTCLLVLGACPDKGLCMAMTLPRL